MVTKGKLIFLKAVSKAKAYMKKSNMLSVIWPNHRFHKIDIHVKITRCTPCLNFWNAKFNYILKNHNFFITIEMTCYNYCIIKVRIPLMCALRAHIKFSIFENIFLGIKKAVFTFLILEKKISKNEN